MLPFRGLTIDCLVVYRKSQRDYNLPADQQRFTGNKADGWSGLYEYIKEGVSWLNNMPPKLDTVYASYDDGSPAGTLSTCFSH